MEENLKTEANMNTIYMAMSVDGGNAFSFKQRFYKSVSHIFKEVPWCLLCGYSSVYILKKPLLFLHLNNYPSVYLCGHFLQV